MREVRERLIRLRDRLKESRVCELSPTHPHVLSHLGIAGCPRTQKSSLSAYHRRYARAKLLTEIQYIEANDRHGDQKPLMWTLLFKWVEWQLPRHQVCMRALQQHPEAQISMLPTFELSIYRAEEPTSAGLTKGILRALSRINFQQPAPCVLFGAKMQKGRKWLSFAISDIRPVTTRECFTVLGAETAQVWNGGAFPIVALLNQAHWQHCEHLFLAEVSFLPTHCPQRAYVSFLNLLLAGPNVPRDSRDQARCQSSTPCHRASSEALDNPPALSRPSSLANARAPQRKPWEPGPGRKCDGFRGATAESSLL
ncbi:hypothetical protein HPB51_001852 [Rhipicephalus microplus]|uniref:Uncharacterized protein n=1 Tax=Rhipicephalus microplus TaxID=6941 RepID=A0A9J6D8E0_RHIMP|nr:hypothetical protein HPB51_001852 [Rhipicephalus microplus]